MTMRGMCLCLLLLFPSTFLCQRRSYDTEDRELMAITVLSRTGVLSSLIPPGHTHDLRQKRVTRPASPPKRAPQGTRFALSLDVPTSILSILIDLAKNHDMRAKAAANAELMARIGKRR